MTQFSLFGAAAEEPSVADLDGVLFAGGHWVRARGAARLSVVVAERWRADALAAEFAARGTVDVASIAGEAGEAEDPQVAATEGGWVARTHFSSALVGPAARWSRGANEAPPADLALTAGGLRLWAVAAGQRCDPADHGYLLGTARPDDPAHAAIHTAAGAQLARRGLGAVAITRGHPGWRITSDRRVRRLAELLGPAPTGGERDWPVAR